MADLTLPGTIPGLLWRCSPVVRGRRRGTVTHMDGGSWCVVFDEPLSPEDAESGESVGLSSGVGDFGGGCGAAGWNLDLSVPTGLIHAVWWMASLDKQRFPAAVSALGLYGPAFDVAFEQALIGRPLDEREIGMIRRVGLYLAEVSDAG